MEKFVVSKKFTVAFIMMFALGVFLPAVVSAESFAVLFSGGYNQYNNHDRYYEETLRMWNIMTDTLGYSADNVYVLFADGTDTAVDRSSGLNSDWSMIESAGGHIEAGTADNLEDTLAYLSGVMDTEDCFDFWSFDHGYGTDTAPDSGGLVAWGSEWVDDDVFASWVDPFDVKAEAYAFAQCYAGDMVDDIMDLDGSDHRFAAWAADWYESSWGKGWADAWADGLEAGLRWTHELGQYAMDNDPYGLLGTGAEHPGWTGANFHIVTNEPIPEPSTVVLLGLGLLWLSTIRRRKR